MRTPKEGGGVQMEAGLCRSEVGAGSPACPQVPPARAWPWRLTWKKCSAPSPLHAQMQEVGRPRHLSLPPQVLGFTWG